MTDPPALKSVSVIVPCRNERGHIGPFLDSLRRQDTTNLEVEYLIADGMSDDGTRETLRDFGARHPEVRLIDNPAGMVSSGLNAAIRLARGDIIVRMDVHTEYASDYLQQCLRNLLETGADNVGGPALTRASGYFQNAVSLAYHSPFSCGGARFHDRAFEGFVDTVTYGCWRKSAFDQFGLFDEELVRNQDDEHNLRLHRAGGRIWQSPSIRSWYHPRSSLGALFRQYAQYGYWKVRVIQKHRLPASFRHLVPGAFVAALLVLGLLAPFHAWFRWLWLLLLGTYALANLAASLAVCREPKSIGYFPVMPFVFAAYHIGYGYGFLRGLIEFGLLRQSRSPAFVQSTRSRGGG